MNTRKSTRLLLLVAVLALVAAACGGGVAATTTADGVTATTGDAGGLPDLGGQNITVALENAYLPFNYIDPSSGEAAGWDYDAVGEICNRINCVLSLLRPGGRG